jgi:polysaccharide biosynthesis/export protein
MGSVIALLPANGWPRLLCDAVWQSTLIAAFGWLTAHFLVRQPGARAWVLLFSLTACVLAPLASMAARGSGWTIMAQIDGATPPQTAGADRNSATTQDELDRAANAPPTGSLSKLSDVSLDQISAAPAAESPHGSGLQPETQARSLAYGYVWLGIGWLLASTLIGVRLALSCLATRRLLRAATPCDDAALLAASVTAAQRIGLRKTPTLLVSGHVQTPTILALGRPRLLIPADHAGRASRERPPCRSVDGKSVDWVAAFAHELAHVARGDGWTRLGVELVLIALPLQPLVWLARRAFHTACEESCDDWAVATGSNPVDLAETLTAWITKSKPLAPLVAIGMSSTKARTLRLLALRGKPVIRLNRAWRWAGIPVALLLIAGFAVAQSPSGEHKKPDHPPTPAAASKGDNKPPSDKTAASSDKTGAKGDRDTLPPYVIDPPDILTITPVQLVPKESTRVAPLDKVRIEVHGTLVDQPITGMFQVDSSGEVVLGPAYGAVKISGLMRLEAQDVVKKKLLELLTQPEVALTIDESRRESGITGKHLVAPDGRINLGIYGTVSVAGLTVTEARAALETKLSESFAEPKVVVDLSAFNSKVFYAVVANQIHRLPITGSETIMDVMSQLSAGPDGVDSISISRPASATSKARNLEVHWKEVVQGDDTTNYQIVPGDRVFVKFVQSEGGGFGGGSGGFGGSAAPTRQKLPDKTPNADKGDSQPPPARP